MLNKQRRFEFAPVMVQQFCSEALSILGKRRSALSIVFVSAKRIRELNKTYRGLDRATDVLSFTYTGETFNRYSFLGEVVLAPAIAFVHRPDQFEPEIRTLLIHGILHLLGFDHETDDGEMERLEARLSRHKKLRGLPPLAL